MAFLEDAVKLLSSLREAFLERSPATVVMKYGAGHPLAGTIAGLLVRTRGQNGAEQYQMHATTGTGVPPIKFAEHEYEHRFSFLPDFGVYVRDFFPPNSDNTPLIFVDGMEARAVIDGEPQHGEPTFTAEPFAPCASLRGIMETRLTHEDFASVIDKLREWLAEDSKMLATLCRVFQYSRTVEAVENIDGSAQLRTKFEGKGGEAPVTLPTEFNVVMPYFSNIAPYEQLPVHLFRIGLRLIPPKGDDGPHFVMRIINLEQVTDEAQRAYLKCVKSAVGDLHVFSGMAEHKHNVLTMIQR